MNTNTYAVEGAVGTRKSHRAYTHAVVVVQTVAAYAARRLPNDINCARRRAEDAFDYAMKCVAGKIVHPAAWKAYIGAEGVARHDEEGRAKGAEFLALNPDRDAYVAAAEQAARVRASEIKEGTFVVSWHHSAALAEKALASTDRNWYGAGSFRVEPTYIAKTHTTRAKVAA